MPHLLTIRPGSRCLILLFLCVLISALGTRAALAAEPPSVPLANTYHEGVDLSQYWLSEKLDGVRAFWDGETLWSRGGLAYQAPAWFTRALPEHPLDGELWAGRGRFAEVSGTVRKHRPVDQEWRAVQFHVFDLPIADTPFRERYRHLVKLVAESDSPVLRLVAQRPVASHQALMAELDRYVEKGAEGLMLKRLDGRYQAGRSDDLLKVKTHQDAEATVIRHWPGKGRLEGLLGSLEVRLEDGRQFRIGSGLTDAERRAPPEVGSTITFRYRGLTSTGLPRFATFLRVRRDEPQSPTEATSPASTPRP